MCIAALKGHANVAKLLIEADANLNQGRTDNGVTPLIAAASKGHIKVVEQLIKVGANLNEPNRRGQSALHIAVTRENTSKSKNNVRVVKALVKAGADQTAKDNFDQTPHDVAKIFRLTEILQILD